MSRLFSEFFQKTRSVFVQHRMNLFTGLFSCSLLAITAESQLFWYTTMYYTTESWGFMLTAHYFRGRTLISFFKTWAKLQCFWHFLEFTSPVSHLSWTHSCVSICFPWWHLLLGMALPIVHRACTYLLYCSCPLRASQRNSTLALHLFYFPGWKKSVK